MTPLLSYMIGTVVTTSPLTVAVGDDTGRPCPKLGEWTVNVDEKVMVLVAVVGGRTSRVGCLPIT